MNVRELRVALAKLGSASSDLEVVVYIGAGRYADVQAVETKTIKFDSQGVAPPKKRAIIVA